ncbi:hypothetical protein KC315_g8650 [Hortaea werneckii]|nr:hypothetical protein KC315_g8650 [Hortaea werneckii]KAI7533936.1 hypothetical protein KC331_g12817 [Hortaea werneckii]KAI7706503.1 hypothetical protein KC353_g12204 [Hortaea werneckii]RMY30868.1 hypothetical protein D0865_15143 [Hortaea werneckii]
MASSTGKKRSAPDSEGPAVTTAIKRRRRTDFGCSSMITRSQTLSAARNAVLHTTELLENILYFLPMKDLLFAQRVCMKWRDLIQRSIPLQEALFFRPKELGVYWKLVPEPGLPSRVVQVDEEQYLLGLPGKVFKAAIPNPLLCQPASGSTRGKNERPGIAWFRSRPSSFHPEASWRKMLIAHAPSCLFEYYFEFTKYPVWPDAEIKTIAFPDDGNAGNVVGFVEEVEAEGLAVEWDGHVLTFPDVMFTTEQELEMGVLE